METIVIVGIIGAIIAVLWWVNRDKQVEEPPMWMPPEVKQPVVQEPEIPVFVPPPLEEEPVAKAAVVEDIHLLSAVKPEKTKKPRKPRAPSKKKKQ